MNSKSPVPVELRVDQIAQPLISGRLSFESRPSRTLRPQLQKGLRILSLHAHTMTEVAEPQTTITLNGNEVQDIPMANPPESDDENDDGEENGAPDAVANGGASYFL